VRDTRPPLQTAQDLASDNSLQARNVYLSRLLAKAGLAAEQRDIADQVQAVLTEELHHRLKNMLAMVAAIVRQSMRAAASLDEAEAAITKRLVAMGRAHDLLLRADWKAAALSQIVQGAIEQHATDARRIRIAGPEMEVASAMILPLTMIMHELCTNAAKYGALSTEDGAVALSWVRDDAAGTMIFHWSESGGPPVSPPKARSFGSRLIENALPRQIGGRGTLDFAAGGVRFELVVPLETLTAPA
jgi:two-component sensor histidine kinase